MCENLYELVLTSLISFFCHAQFNQPFFANISDKRACKEGFSEIANKFL
jgi:hypothetical protein